MQVTVAICTYNGGARIAPVLRGLAAQSQPRDDWEVLVIDNASSDATGKIAAELMDSLLAGRGRVVREETLGLTNARHRAATEARGGIVCFLDDDNVPAPDFVANAIRAFVELPKAVAIGGKVKAVWEKPPSPLVLAVQDFALAICDRGDEVFRYGKNVGPVGAGMCIRTEILRNILNEKSGAAILGRKGADLASGDDLAIGILTWKFGGECWYVPSLKIEHMLPARRMEKQYLLNLYEGIGRGQAAVRPLHDWKARNPALAVLIGAKDLGRWIRGAVFGPPKNLRSEFPDLAGDLHELNQRLVMGRAMQTFAELKPS